MDEPEQTVESELNAPPSGAGPQQARPRRHRRAFVMAVVRTQNQIDRASQTAGEVRVALRQVRNAVDPREVAGGYVGLAAGETIGGAVGGVAGAVVAGPPGAVVGAELGAFTAGMLGLKLGMDAVHDLREATAAGQSAGRDEQPVAARKAYGSLLRGKARGRVGEIVGLTSGATVGLVIAGPAGGLVGAVVGETVGGRLKESLGRLRNEADVPAQSEKPAGVSERLDRFGKNTAGEAATVLVAGSVGALFGASGMKVGQRIGRVVSKRVEWDKLGKPALDMQPAGQILLSEHGLAATEIDEAQTPASRESEDENHL